MKYGIAILDEVNPHLIYQLNRQDRELTDDRLKPTEWDDLPPIFVEENRRKAAVKDIRDRFLSTYDEATKFIDEHDEGPILLNAARKATKVKTFYPLAYRLDLRTESVAIDNPYTHNKFGGVPHPKLTSYGKHEVERAWPWCPNCREPMRFLGQLDLSFESWVIHHLTSYDVGREFPAPLSGLGWRSSDHGIPHTHSMHQYFFCTCNNFDSPNFDAVVIEQYMFDGDEKMVPEVLDQYQAFMEKHKLLIDGDDMGGVISPQRVNAIDIGLDLDFPNEGWNNKVKLWDVDDLHDEFRDKFRADRGDFTVWGAPRSQQTEKRFFGSHYMFAPRMAPIINWNDESHDVTRQMYGCYRTYRGPGKMHCRMDNSNT